MKSKIIVEQPGEEGSEEERKSYKYLKKSTSINKPNILSDDEMDGKSSPFLRKRTIAR